MSAPTVVASDLTSEAAAARPGVLARILVALISLYRATARLRAPRCRFLPTCSAFAVESIEAHGAGRGAWLAVRRIARCHPWNPGGFDPVPAPSRDRLRRSPTRSRDRLQRSSTRK